MEKAKKVVRGKSMERDHGIPSGFCLQCVDSSFIETKKGEKIPLTTVTRGEME
jgi:hypothetical protein